MTQRRVYFDNNATTRCWDSVWDAMREAACEAFGNPSSVHDEGARACYLLESARVELAMAIGADPDEVIFTSGGTESNNIALNGLIKLAAPERNHVVCSAIEHPAVLGTLKAYAEAGRIELSLVNPDSQGVIQPSAVADAITDRTCIVACMLANNETGVIQPVAELAKLAHERGAHFHCDIVQAVGKVPVNLHALGVDTAAISSHKFHGPKGIGALYQKRGLKLPQLQFGGGHEQGVRPGTVNVMGVVGMGRAATLCAKEMQEKAARMAALRDKLQAGLCALNPDAAVHGAGVERLPNTLSISFPGRPAMGMVRLFSNHGVSCSAGSACSSTSKSKFSHVLMAMGLSEDAAGSALRFSLDLEVTEADIDHVLAAADKVLALAPAKAAV